MSDTDQIEPCSAALPPLELAVASVPGRDHLRVGRRCQDALAVVRSARHLVAVVADGCGSAPYSEIGAHLGARWMAAELSRQLEAAPGERPTDAPGDRGLPERVFVEAQRAVLANLRQVAASLPGSLEEVVREQLLFTLVGAAIGPLGLRTFSLGDGVISLDGRPRELGPFPGNSPPYLGYALLPPSEHGFGASALALRLDPVIAAEQWTTLALATDGACCDSDPLRLAAPLLRSLLADERLFLNPDALRRALWLRVRGPAPMHGGLADDTSVIFIRNRGRGGAPARS